MTEWIFIAYHCLPLVPFETLVMFVCIGAALARMEEAQHRQRVRDAMNLKRSLQRIRDAARF